MYDSFLTLTRARSADLDRVRADLDPIFGRRVSPRAVRPAASPASEGAFPAINLRQTAQAIDIQMFAPGIDASRTEVTLDRGVLTIAGERSSDVPTATDKNAEPPSVRSNERYAGRFRRVVTLPDDADPNQVSASYCDGVLHINVQRRAATPPTRIAIA